MFFKKNQKISNQAKTFAAKGAFVSSQSTATFWVIQKQQKPLRQMSEKSTTYFFAQKKRQKIVQNGYLQNRGGSV